MKYELMYTLNIETTINTEGELHLDHLPLHQGDRVKVVITTPNGDETLDRQSEYERFMAAYAEEDSVYDKL